MFHYKHSLVYKKIGYENTFGLSNKNLISNLGHDHDEMSCLLSKGAFVVRDI